jgi:hypothetical protein
MRDAADLIGNSSQAISERETAKADHDPTYGENSPASRLSRVDEPFSTGTDCVSSIRAIIDPFQQLPRRLVLAASLGNDAAQGIGRLESADHRRDRLAREAAAPRRTRKPIADLDFVCAKKMHADRPNQCVRVSQPYAAKAISPLVIVGDEPPSIGQGERRRQKRNHGSDRRVVGHRAKRRSVVERKGPQNYALGFDTRKDLATVRCQESIILL